MPASNPLGGGTYPQSSEADHLKRNRQIAYLLLLPFPAVMLVTLAVLATLAYLGPIFAGQDRSGLDMLGEVLGYLCMLPLYGAFGLALIGDLFLLLKWRAIRHWPLIALGSIPLLTIAAVSLLSAFVYFSSLLQQPNLSSNPPLMLAEIAPVLLCVLVPAVAIVWGWVLYIVVRRRDLSAARRAALAACMLILPPVGLVAGAGLLVRPWRGARSVLMILLALAAACMLSLAYGSVFLDLAIPAVYILAFILVDVLGLPVFFIILVAQSLAGMDRRATASLPATGGSFPDRGGAS